MTTRPSEDVLGTAGRERVDVGPQYSAGWRAPSYRHAALLHTCNYHWLHAAATKLGPGLCPRTPLHALSRDSPPVTSPEQTHRIRLRQGRSSVKYSSDARDPRCQAQDRASGGYRSSYETMQPVPMGSAALKYAADGRVAWDQIWESFCDLAMAGGPPHKGALLEPGSLADIEAEPGRYQEATDEICRGVTLVTDLQAVVSSAPGWVRVRCYSDTMADWLLRAITMENVAVRRSGDAIDLPASPAFRLEKEIKNVITVIAKTSHYWLGHMPSSQKRAIADLFAALAAESPLIEPSRSETNTNADARSRTALAEHIRRELVLASHPIVIRDGSAWSVPASALRCG